MIIALFKLISPFHSSEQAWYDAKQEGLPPYLSAKFIGSVFVLGAAGMAVFGYTVTSDQIKVLSDNVYNIINGAVGIYGVAMVISHQFFKKKPLKENVMASASQSTPKTVASDPVAPAKVEPKADRIVILPVPSIGKDNPPQPPPPPQTSGDDEPMQSSKKNLDKVTGAND